MKPQAACVEYIHIKSNHIISSYPTTQGSKAKLAARQRSCGKVNLNVVRKLASCSLESRVTFLCFTLNELYKFYSAKTPENTSYSVST
jgi:hypothetical protein